MRIVGSIAVLAVLLVGACTDGDAADPTALDGSSLTVEDSCGESFTVRNSSGTARLTITPNAAAREGSPPGVFDLGEDGWTGELEVGTGLKVWPCHDIGSDFDNERVSEVLAVTGGSVELLDAIPSDGDSGGSGTVRAHVVSVTAEASDGTTAEMGDIPLENPSWGFYGG